MPHFVKAAVGLNLDVIEPELFDRPFPVVPDRRGNNNEGVRAVFREAVVKEEFLAISVAMIVFPRPTTSARKKPLCFSSRRKPLLTASIW